jgi:phage terminase large subunit GpA-like protein
MDSEDISKYNKIKNEISKNGLLLENYKDTVYATSYELAYTAVINNGNALEYVLDNYKDRFEIVMIAFISNEESLQYASPRIKELFANKRTLELIQTIGASLQHVNLKPAKR